MLHNDLFKWLNTTPQVKTLFPGGVYHESLPQSVDTFPAMSFLEVSHVELGEDMEAPNDDKIDQSGYQFDVVAETSGPAIQAAATFLEIFRNFRGTMISTRIAQIGLANKSHLEEKRGDKLRRRVSLDFSITYHV